MQEAFNAWYTYMWENLTKKVELRVDAAKQRLHYADCLFNCGDSTLNTWQEVASLQACLDCADTRLMYILRMRYVVSLVESAVKLYTNPPAAKYARDTPRVVAEALYEILSTELDENTWRIWEEDFSYVSGLFTDMENALSEEAEKYFSTEDTADAWRNEAKYFYLFCEKQSLLGRSAADRPCVSAALARGLVAGNDEYWILSLPESTARNLFKDITYSQTSSADVAENLNWDTVLAFLNDGLALPDAIQTATALQ